MARKTDADRERERKEHAERQRREEDERRARKASVVQETDLRPICRASDRCITVVTLHVDWEARARWLVLGETQIRQQSDRRDGRWRLEAYMADATDFEHDSAYALRLPLVGLEFTGLDYHRSTFHAWIDPNAVDEFSQDFHVPRPGYDPRKDPKARTCSGTYDGKENFCKWNEGRPHPVVPEGFYVPPYDADLYGVVRGKLVEISCGPVRKDGAEES